MTETGIYLTALTPPHFGWPMAFYCPICKTTTFLYNAWAVKPTDGDYFLMKKTCVHEELATQHNIQMWREDEWHKRTSILQRPL